MTTNVFDPNGSDAVLVERLLGSSYETVKFVVQNIAILRTLANQMDSVVALQDSAVAISALGAVIDKLDGLYAQIETIVDVHAEMSDINAIGANITAIQAVEASLEAIVTVGNDLVAIANIAPHVAAIGQVYSVLADVTLVSSNMATLTFISENISELIAGLEGVSSVMDSRRATQAEAQLGTSNSVFSTPLRVAEQISARIGTTAGTVAAGNDARILGAMQKAANGQDIVDKAAFRANLGLGEAATKVIGQIAGTVAAGDDPRFDPTFPWATNAEALAGESSTAIMTPLRVKEAIVSKLDKAGGTITGNLNVSGNHVVAGTISTSALGEIGARIEARASAYATSAQNAAASYTETRAAAHAAAAQANAISSANATALNYANIRVSSIALGSVWNGTRPAGGVATDISMMNQGEGQYTMSVSGKYLYYYTPTYGWVVAGDI